MRPVHHFSNREFFFSRDRDAPLAGPGRGGHPASSICQRANPHLFFPLLSSDSPSRFYTLLSTSSHHGYFCPFNGCKSRVDEQRGSSCQHFTVLRLANGCRNVHVWSNQRSLDIYGELVAINAKYHERKCHPASSVEFHWTEFGYPGVCFSCNCKPFAGKATIQWFWRLLPTTGQRVPHCWNRPSCE